jgi:hypothetical protein
MPIDIKLLRNDPSSQSSLRLSLYQRQQPPEFLDHVLHLDKVTREAHIDLTMYKSRVKRKEVALNKDQLAHLLLAHKKSLDGLKRALQRLANFVDEVLLQEFQKTVPNHPTQPRDIPRDPFYCVMGYDDWTTHAVLTRLGLDLAGELQRYILSSLNSTLRSETVFELPDSFAVSQDRHRDVYGYEHDRMDRYPKDLPVDVNTPSWVTMLDLHHKGKTYWDRQLPLINILSVTGTKPFTPLTVREDKGKPRTKTSWYQQLTVSNSIQLVAITGASLESDSRPLQKEIMQKVQVLYQSLAPESARMHVRASPVSELSFNESSRLVLESFVGKEKRALCLASVSNMHHYTSSEIRHGSTGQRVHVLVAHISSIPATLEWIFQHGATTSEVNIPKVLQSTTIPGTIPYRRKVTLSKSGRRIVQDIASPAVNVGHVAQPPFGMPTIDEIRAEALSSPFGFLPFYSKDIGSNNHTAS